MFLWLMGEWLAWPFLVRAMHRSNCCNGTAGNQPDAHTGGANGRSERTVEAPQWLIACSTGAQCNEQRRSD